MRVTRDALDYCCRIACCGKPVPTFPRDALVRQRASHGVGQTDSASACQQRRPGRSPNDAVGHQVLLLLELHHCVEGFRAEIAIGADGDFGPKTFDAVVKFQKKKDLMADGIVGRATWAALLAG